MFPFFPHAGCVGRFEFCLSVCLLCGVFCQSTLSVSCFLQVSAGFFFLFCFFVSCFLQVSVVFFIFLSAFFKLVGLKKNFSAAFFKLVLSFSQLAVFFKLVLSIFLSFCQLSSS